MEQDDYKIKNQEKSRSLKKAGLSDEQAKRFSNVESNQKADSEMQYEKWSREDLYKRAEELQIEGIASMDKNLLIEAIRQKED